MQLVLSKDFINRACRALEERRSHEQIIMYMAVLKQRTENTDAKPLSTDTMYEDLRRWLNVPSNGEISYYRPFTSRGDNFWMNSNLAGSFAPSSLRSDRKRLFYNSDDSLRVPTPEEVSDTLLKGKSSSPLACWATAGFIFRNALFSSQDGTEGLDDLVSFFKKHFGIADNEEDYSLVFDDGLPDGVDDVFEVVSDIGYSGELTISDQDYRTLDSDDLGLKKKSDSSAESAGPLATDNSEEADRLDEIEKRIVEALELYSGVILSGAPGTSKSYYAERVAIALTDGDYERMRFTQFHASYQFEDFIQGYVPDPDRGSFKQKDGIFLSLCKTALEDPGNSYVIIIDELSRGDSCRVFGEALTYIEKSKRGKYFYLPSGEQMTVPANVYIIATMNPIDRGADEVDVAFGRRFATIDMEPSSKILESRLIENNVDGVLRGQILQWFASTNAICERHHLAGVGHAYFWNVRDIESLRRAWEYQVIHHLRRSFGLHVNERDSVETRMNEILG